MKKLYVLIFSLFCMAMATKAQYTLLYSFTGTGGGNPEFGALTVSGGVLYGMTSEYSTGTGNMFSINTNGTNYTDLYDFALTTGESPYGSFLNSGGVFYGMTSYGGSTYPYGSGTVFAINPSGSGYTELYHFINGTAGSSPDGSLILSGGVFYGMTLSGGANGLGNVFSVNMNGSGYADLLDFNSTNGKQPYGSLVISGNTLYGMTFGGGVNGDGLIFSINTNGTGYTDMLDFNGTNGSNPYGSLILSGTVLYGTTFIGGINSQGNIFSINTNGTGYTDLFDFNNTDGSGPQGDLLLVGNVLCGMTKYGGIHSDGNIFSIKTNGTGYTDLFDFNGTNGSEPEGTLAYSGGVLYGMTYIGGASGYGVIFSFNVSNLGLNELASSEGTIKLYPNPTNGIFTIQSSSVNNPSSVEIYNTLGAKIYNSKLNSTNTTVDISNNADGVYLYRVLSESGELVSEGKFVIQK
jgi:uncharacterized repeat protein (TIGR03803 family)